MNKYLRVFGLISLLCFSFYYTNKIASFIKSKDPIYESIMMSKEDYEIKFLDAIIEDDVIIPGLMGKEINVEKSFHNMKNYGYFSTNELVFDETKPNVSLENNLYKKIENSSIYFIISVKILSANIKELCLIISFSIIKKLSFTTLTPLIFS